MAAKTQAAALLLWLVVVASSPRAALGSNCRNECNAACIGWPIVCQLSCASACFGQSGISTMSTGAAATAPPKHPAASAPAPSPQQQQLPEGGGVFVLRKGLLKPSSSAN